MMQTVFSAVAGWEATPLNLVASWTAAATVLFAFAALLVGCSLRASASLRHAIWAAAAIVALALPAVGFLAPVHARSPAARLASHLDLSYISGFGARSTVPARRASARRTPAGNERIAHESRSDALARGGVPPTTVLIAWALGSLLALGRIASGYYRSHCIARQSDAVADPILQRRFLAAQDAVGEHRAELRMSPALAVPAVFGTRRPSVLLPRDFGSWAESDQYATLVHELAHVRRRDCAVQTLVQVSRAMFWPSPAVWYVARRVRIEQERACDDVVLTAGASATGYARVLLRVVSRMRADARLPLAMPAFGSRSKLESRIIAVLDDTRTRRTPPALGAVAALVLLAVAVPLGGAVATPSLREGVPPRWQDAPVSGSNVAPARRRAAPDETPFRQGTELGRTQHEPLQTERTLEASAAGEPRATAESVTARRATMRTAGGDSLRSERVRRNGEEFMRFHRERIRAHGLDAIINNSELYAWFMQEEWRAGVVHAGLASMPQESASWSADYVRSDISARLPELDIKRVLVLEVPVGDGARANIALVTVPRAAERR